VANHDAVCGPQQKSKDTGADENFVFPSGAVENFMSDEISWDDQRVFLAVLEAGSFAAAARKLAVSHPTVRSRIEVLENALERCTRIKLEIMFLTVDSQAHQIPGF